MFGRRELKERKGKRMTKSQSSMGKLFLGSYLGEFSNGEGGEGEGVEGRKQYLIYLDDFIK